MLISKSFWFWFGFFINMFISLMVVMINSGCNGEYIVRMDELLLSPIDEHEECKNHYIDPYTKIEYCLPENFINMNQIHLYRVGELND